VEEDNYKEKLLMSRFAPVRTSLESDVVIMNSFGSFFFNFVAYHTVDSLL